MTPIARKNDIKDLSKDQLTQWLRKQGQPSFRADQLLRWLYLHQIDRFEGMTNLGKPLQSALSATFVNARLGLEEKNRSSDGCLKFLFRLQDGQHIESVLIPEKDHFTLCVSSQVGCNQGCKFCMTAKTGFVRNLSAGEIISQVRDLQQFVKDNGEMALTNIVFMGMGEPLANLENVVQSIDVITNGDWGLKISGRRVTVSTAGLVPKMRALGENTRVNLAVSLNAADDDTRTRLMPINRKHPIAQLMAACRAYPLPTRRKITFEYILMKGINDRIADAQRLVKLLRPVKSKINLIPFNEHPGSEFQRPEPNTIDRFKEFLAAHHYTAIVRHSKGQDIGAACGQLRARKLSKNSA
jgi:23S rRNA (adenine2503-C2)-methyltransferase